MGGGEIQSADAVWSSHQARLIRELAQQVAEDRRWPKDWLNDGARGFLHGYESGSVVFSDTGITVAIPGAAQLLALKLGAWRDDVDQADARVLLQAARHPGEAQVALWERVHPYVVPGRQLKAKLALETIWEAAYGHD